MQFDAKLTLPPIEKKKKKKKNYFFSFLNLNFLIYYISSDLKAEESINFL